MYTRMIPELKTLLSELGFNEKETNVYLALLKVGSAPASLLGKQVKIPRSTAKFICEQLHKKNVINSSQRKNTIIYSIDSPEKLYYVLQQQKELIEQKEEELGRKMTDLKSYMNPNTVLPKVQFFEGSDGIAQLHDIMIADAKKGATIKAFTKYFSNKTKTKDIRSESERFKKKRHKKDISLQVIAPFSESAQAIFKENKGDNIYFVAPDTYDFEGGDIFINEDALYTMSIENGIWFGYIVRSPSIAKLHHSLFDTALKTAKDTHKKYSK